ncbi:MAG: GGDEF domain-containing protein, partial [Pseudomonadota bacterium]
MLLSSPVYLYVTLTLTCLMYSVISFFAWRIYLRKPYILFWHLAFLAATARWTAELIGSDILGTALLTLFTEVFALLVIIFASMGHCFRVGSERVLRYIFSCALVGSVILLWSTLISPHDGIREAAVPGVSAATALLIAYAVYQYNKSAGSADRVLASGLALFGLVQVISTLKAFGLGQAADASALLAHRHMELLTLPIAYIVIGTLVLFVFVSDASRKLKGMAVLDQLTGLLNRHGYEGLGQRAFAEARSAEKPLSVIIADLDRFKAVNDRYGHAVGDQALLHFANRLRANRKGDDIVARIGGEEFLVLLPGTTLDKAAQAAQSIRAETIEIPVVGGERPLTISASFGVAELSDEDSNISDMVARADHALYRAKRRGRNRVERASKRALTLSETTLQRL